MAQRVRTGPNHEFHSDRCSCFAHASIRAAKPGGGFRRSNASLSCFSNGSVIFHLHLLQLPAQHSEGTLELTLSRAD